MIALLGCEKRVLTSWELWDEMMRPFRLQVGVNRDLIKDLNSVPREKLVHLLLIQNEPPPVLGLLAVEEHRSGRRT